MLPYPVVAERGARNYSAYLPDLPGCVTTGGSLPELRRMMAEAVALHTEEMRADGDPIPPPPAWARFGAPSLSCEIERVHGAGGAGKDGKNYEVLLLLDGFPMNWDSAFTWVDGELLSELGVAAERRRRLPLPSGGTAVRDVGYIRIRCGGKETVDEAVFAKKKDFSALGVRALLGLQIAPPAKFRRLSAARLLPVAA